MIIILRWAFISAAILLYPPGQVQSHVLRDDFSGLCSVLPATFFLPFFGQTAVRGFSVRSQTVPLPCLSPSPHGSCHRWSEGVTSFLPLTPWLTASQVQEHLLFLKECPPLLPPRGLCFCCAICLRHFFLLASACLEFLLHLSLYSAVTS